MITLPASGERGVVDDAMFACVAAVCCYVMRLFIGAAFFHVHHLPHSC